MDRFLAIFTLFFGSKVEGLTPDKHLLRAPAAYDFGAILVDIKTEFLIKLHC